MYQRRSLWNYGLSQLTLVFITGFMQPQFTWSLHGQCKSRCDIHRNHGNKSAYLLNCRDAYDKAADIKYCQGNCADCPNYVCDESRNPNIFHCPSIEVKGKCRSRCDKGKLLSQPKGIFKWFFFDCNELYKNNAAELSSCREDCSSCPAFICNSGSDKNLYFCTNEEINRECLQRCSKIREIGSTNAFDFRCASKYGMDSEKEHCRNDCSTCPSEICDESINSNLYHCPAVVALKESTEQKRFSFNYLFSLIKKGINWMATMVKTKTEKR